MVVNHCIYSIDGYKEATCASLMASLQTTFDCVHRGGKSWLSQMETVYVP